MGIKPRSLLFVVAIVGYFVSADRPPMAEFRDLVMGEVLNCIKQSKEPSQALDLVKFAADFSLQSTSKLARRALEEFQLSEEQRKALADMTAESSDNSDGE